jgi:lauroyl/myristoyl acyltransferase
MVKEGKNVLYAIDQDYGIKHSKKINFFGIPTFTITTAERLQEDNKL